MDKTICDMGRIQENYIYNAGTIIKTSIPLPLWIMISNKIKLNISMKNKILEIWIWAII